MIFTCAFVMVSLLKKGFDRSSKKVRKSVSGRGTSFWVLGAFRGGEEGVSPN